MPTPLTNGLLCLVVGVPLLFNALLVLCFVAKGRALDGVHKRLDDICRRLDAIEARLLSIENRLGTLERKVDALEIKAWR